ILRGAHGSDEELAELWLAWQERHLYAMRRAVESLVARDALRPGLAPDEAVDVLYALAGTEVYRSLVRERGWAPERYEDWLFRTIRTELVG
ncbi:MAG TPA: hypothetical protein VFU72_13865, partial [Nitrolancea sp.]|nr:hypothetical protein [Nitrolancea sp.]